MYNTLDCSHFTTLIRILPLISLYSDIAHIRTYV